MSYGTVQDQIKAGKIRYLFFSVTSGIANSPMSRALFSLVYRARETDDCRRLYVHKDTPEPIEKILIDVFKKTYDNPEFKKGLANFGEEPRYGGPEFVRDAIRKGEEVGVPIIKELGLYVGK